MYVLGVWMRLRVFMSVWALYGEANGPSLEKLRKAKFHTNGTFETSKYQNRAI